MWPLPSKSIGKLPGALSSSSTGPRPTLPMNVPGWLPNSETSEPTLSIATGASSGSVSGHQAIGPDAKMNSLKFEGGFGSSLYGGSPVGGSPPFPSVSSQQPANPKTT